LVNVGLDYLSFSRKGPTLSGGESQRIRLASQVGSELTGVLYILDEPSIGLHQRDNIKLLDTLCHLRDIGNTLIVVEHDRETMEVVGLDRGLRPRRRSSGGRNRGPGHPQTDHAPQDLGHRPLFERPGNHRNAGLAGEVSRRPATAGSPFDKPPKTTWITSP
jgi:hypothetical protein